MGTKITRYPNMKILPSDGVKFKCKCGCEFVAFGKDITVSGNFLGGDTEFYYANAQNVKRVVYLTIMTPSIIIGVMKIRIVIDQS